MSPEELQSLCELGQEQLMRMDYLSARESLERAESLAWQTRDWDSLSRLYMPLQEVHRQIRQRCGEGILRLDLIARSSTDQLNAASILETISSGQLLIAGWNSIAPALEARRLARQRKMYVEVFLGSVKAGPRGRPIVAIYPLENLSNVGFELDEAEIPKGSNRGDSPSYSLVMSWWERLHSPFLKGADEATEAVRKIEGYRQTIAVDCACELAHQRLSDIARQLARTRPL